MLPCRLLQRRSLGWTTTAILPRSSSRSIKLECTLIAARRDRSRRFASSATPSKPEPDHPSAAAARQPSQEPDTSVYRGPLAGAYRSLKIFSLSGLACAWAFTPLIFISDSALPLGARFALAGVTLFAGTLSTVLVAWCGRPYVVTMRRLTDGGVHGLEIVTSSMFLKPRITKVYDTQFLVNTKRAFALWELAENTTLPTSEKNSNEETVAETLDAHGKLLGSWIVKWDKDGKGTCHGVGNIVR